MDLADAESANGFMRRLVAHAPQHSSRVLSPEQRAHRRGEEPGGSPGPLAASVVQDGERLPHTYLEGVRHEQV